MFRVSGKLAALAVAAVVISSSIAQAAVIGTSTLVRNPPTTLFTVETALNVPNNWVAYTLGVSTNDGSVITGIDANISGQLHQRWVLAEDEETGDIITTKTPAIAGTTNGDSHFLVDTANILIGSPLDEDNSGNGSPQPDTAIRNFGVGSFLKGAWGIPAQFQSTSATFAYIVVPRGSEPSLDLNVQIGLPGGAFATLTEADFFPQVANPVVGDLALTQTLIGEVVGGMVPVTDVVTLTLNNAAAPTFTPLIPGKPLILNTPPTIGNDGSFSWNTAGALRGTYVWGVTGVNGAASDGGTVTVTVTAVPEPATLCLLGLALAGFAGFRRK